MSHHELGPEDRTRASSWRLLALLLALPLGAACGDNQDPAGAEALWQALQEVDYRSWPRAPGYEERRGSNAPHGDKVDIYINDVLAEALASGESLERWPNGSVIVKDGFDGGDLELVAAMEKRLTGWYWVEYAAGGEAIYSGSPETCTDCHKSGDDYVRAFELP
ncbi:MAG: hypothetical protein OEZ06_24785 [Myxococcales bacterium]|nr:hypothetical protein [Myxococcales bacterium]